MIKLKTKPGPIVLHCSISVPEVVLNSLVLNCANLGPGRANRHPYTYTPQELQKLIDYVKNAPNSRFRFSCLKNGKLGETGFAKTIREYNRTHPDRKIDWEDLVNAVKSIDTDPNHFAGAKISQTTDKPTRYDDGVFYEWRLPLSVLFPDAAAVDQTVPGSTRLLDKDALYVKLFVFGNQKRKAQKNTYYYQGSEPIEVASIHRNSDTPFFGQNKNKEAAKRRKMGDKAYVEEQQKNAKSGVRYFNRLENLEEKRTARRIMYESSDNMDGTD